MTPRRIQQPGNRRRAGFTLLEIVIVAAVVILLLSIALTASVDWGRQTAARTSLDAIETGLAAARQLAVTGGEGTTFTYANTNIPPSSRGFFQIRNADGPLAETAFLANGIVFTGNTNGVIAFRCDGSARATVGSWTNGIGYLTIGEAARGSAGINRTIKIWRHTGVTEVLE